jgi:hypothetical protein
MEAAKAQNWALEPLVNKKYFSQTPVNKSKVLTCKKL